MASSSKAMPINCSSRERGCWIRLRRVTGAALPGSTQNRSVETTSFRRVRSSRYSATETAAIAPNATKNWPRLRLRNSIPLNCERLRYAPRSHHRSENRFFERHRSRQPAVLPVVPQRDLFDTRRKDVERLSVSPARFVIHLYVETSTALGIRQIHLAIPRRQPIFI